LVLNTDNSEPVNRAAPSPGPTTILVVDDDPDVLWSTSKILRDAGFVVLEGAGAVDAIKLTQEHCPALVLLDVNLPDGNGIDVALQIKKDPLLSSVFVVLCSGERISSKDQVDGLRQGLADGYIIRPVGKDELIARIDAFLRIRATQEALRESEERLRTIILSMQFGIVIIDAKTHTILKANDKALEMIRGTRESVLGLECHRFICPAESGKCPVTDLGQNVDSSERILLNQRGEKVPIIKSVIRTTLGGKDVLIESFIDITARKKAEEALAFASKKLALLSGITRHDINNQLTILLGYHAMLGKKQPDLIHNNYFGTIKTVAQRISAMIQFTGEYEKIGVHAPVWQDCRTLADTASKQAPLGKVIVKNDLPAGQEVFADPLIVKVFYNLMDNAVRYGGKSTTIQFSVEEAGDDHLIVCEDDGDGVVTQEKEKIFERGFGKNTGLGLALAREILDITGITIRETGEPGKGARFEMTVPKGVWRMKGKCA
jgi:PAS domain S-box-containing protein